MRVAGIHAWPIALLVFAAASTCAAMDSQRPADTQIQLLTRDIDGDHDLDLLVVSAIEHRPVNVFVNNGDGNFSKGHIEDYPDSIWKVNNGPGIYTGPGHWPLPAFSLQLPRAGSAMGPAGTSRPVTFAAWQIHCNPSLTAWRAQLWRQPSRAPPSFEKLA